MSYVLVDADRIAAFVTLASGSVILPNGLRGRMPAHPLPILLVARLGVDAAFKGQKLARRLLQECCKLAVEQAGVVGCCGLVTDAKPDVIEQGIQRHFLGIRHFKPRVEALASAERPK